MRLGEHAAGHRHRQLEVVGRIGGDEIDRAIGDRRQERERVADAHLDARRIERPRAAGVGRAQVGQCRPGAVPFVREVAHDLLVDRRPARVELDPDGASRSTRDRGAEERPADAGERIEDQLAAAAEELDQPGHQSRRLVRAMDPAGGVSELGWVGGRQQRLGEVQPLLAGQLVERVGGVRGAPAIGHAGQPRRRDTDGWPWTSGLDRMRCAGPRMLHGRHLHERALRGARSRVRPARRQPGRRRPRPDANAPARGHGGNRCHPLPRRGDRPDPGAARPDDGPPRDRLARPC